MNTLDSWAADAKDRIAFLTNPYEVSSRGVRVMHPKEVDERILALIDLIRRKDEALKCLIREVELGTVPVFKGSPNVDYAREALALTDQLGRGEGK